MVYDYMAHDILGDHLHRTGNLNLFFGNNGFKFVFAQREGYTTFKTVPRALLFIVM
mgnify:CR=1 FL=1